MTDLAHVVRAVVGAAAGPPSGLLDRLCLACATALPVDGVAISVMAAAGQRIAGSVTDERVARLEDLQFTLGEGPAVSAFEHREPVAAPDLLHDAVSWPVFAAEAAAVLRGPGRPLRSVFAFPLQLRDEPLGVLDVYRREAGDLGPDLLVQTRTAVDAVVLALFGSAAVDGSPDGPPWLLPGLADQVVLDQAVGMVMAQAHLGAEAALARLRGHAFTHNRTLHQVAQAVIARELRFAEDRP